MIILWCATAIVNTNYKQSLLYDYNGTILNQKPGKRFVFFTLATIAVLAPNLADITHWLAPLPPKPIKNLLPWIVSPGLGSLWVKLKQIIAWVSSLAKHVLYQVFAFILHETFQGKN